MRCNKPLKIHVLFILSVFLYCAFASGTTIDIVNDYGADPTGVTDSADDFQQALDYAETQSGETIIVIPPGQYLMNSKCTYSINSGTNKKLTIQGSGELASRIRINNTTGWLDVKELNGSIGLQFEISGLTINPETQVTGHAIYYMKNAYDTGVQYYGVFQDIFIKTRIPDVYVLNPIEVAKVKNLRMNNVWISPGPGPAVLGDPYLVQENIMLVNCPDAELDFISSFSASKGIVYYIDDASFVPGSVNINNPWIVNVAQGIHFQNVSGTDPMVVNARINHGHINYRDYGAHLYRVANVKMDHMLVYCRDKSGTTSQGGDGGTARAGSWKGVWCHESDDVLIEGNNFAEACNPNNSSVYIDAFSNDIEIRGNIFSSEGTAIYERSPTTTYSIHNVLDEHRVGNWSYTTLYNVSGSFIANDLN